MHKMQMLGQMVKRAREREGLSLNGLAKEMARDLGIKADHSYLSDVEKGAIKRPDKGRVLWVATRLGLPLGEVYLLADFHPDSDEDTALLESPPDLRDATRELSFVPAGKRPEVLELIRRIIRLHAEDTGKPEGQA